jgi:hypothetical protein
MPRCNPQCAEKRGARRERTSEECDLLGDVVTAQDPRYPAAITNLIQLFTSYPFAVNFVRSEAEIQAAVCWAQEHNIAIRLRSGRNNLMGWCSADAALVIDVSHMKAIEVDTKRKRVTFEAGVTQGELVNTLSSTGFYTALGDEAILGMPLLLGGGIGMLSRNVGCGCDSLLSLRIVTADGNTVTASRNKNPELLFASRGGGGGNFGVATSFTMRLYEAPREVVTFTCNFPFSQFIPAFEAWQRMIKKNFKNKKLGSKNELFIDHLFIKGVFLGTLQELGSTLDELFSVPGGTCISSQVPFSTFFHITPLVEEPFQHYSDAWVPKFYDRRALEIIQDFCSRAPSPLSSFFTLAWGNHTCIQPKGGSAIPQNHRCAKYFAEIGPQWHDPAIDGAAFLWMTQFRMAMDKYFLGAYVNVSQVELLNWPRNYYGEEIFKRLQAVKKKWDPRNVFSFDQSIPPCISTKISPTKT